MTTLERKLGSRIARHRKALGLTQAKLAEQVRVQPETICRLEAGSVGVSLRLVIRIAAAIHLELHELLLLRESESKKELALERLSRFVARLSAAEIELVLDIAASVMKHVRPE